MKYAKNKNKIDKKRKDNKTLSQKNENRRNFFLTEDNKKKEPKIKISAHELLAFTLSYLMLTPW
jgi:AAA15 family ATPase/GTPase